MQKTRIAAVLLLGVFLLLIGCTLKPVSRDINSNFNEKYNYEITDTNSYEITETDVFEMLSKRLIKSTNIAVKGVKLGDRYLDVQKKLGLPDYVEDYADGNTNLKYEKDGEAYLIIHLDNNTVTRIVVRPGMNDMLPGKSRITGTLEDIIKMFGKPSSFADTQFFVIYSFKPYGLEVYTKGKQMTSYGFVPPEKIE